MFCRVQVSLVIRLLSLCGLAAPLCIPSDVRGEDYRILLVRDGAVDRERQLPAGELVSKGGFLDGIEVGMTGTVWRSNKISGEIEIADLEVTDVSAYEATCRYVVRHRDFFVLKKDRVRLEPVDHNEAQVLALAVELLTGDRCFDAFLLFQSIYCATRDNAFVQAQIADCLARVNQRLAEEPPKNQKLKIGLKIRDFLELAERQHKFDNDLAADLYLKRALALDPGNTGAATLRDAIPDQDYQTLLSPARCE